jgi:ATP-binding cassette subfamily B protein
MFGMLAAPLALAAAVPLKIAVDSLIGSRPLPGLLAACLPAGTHSGSAIALASVAALMVVIAVLTQLLNFASSILRSYTGEHLVLHFRARLFRHCQRLSLAYHDSRGTSDSTYRIQWDAPCVQWIIVDGLIPLASAGLTLVLMFAVVVRLDWRLGLVSTGVCPLLFLITRRYKIRLRARSHDVKEFDSSVLSLQQEVFSAIRVVKAFGQEDREHVRFIERAKAGLWARVKLAMEESSFAALMSMTFAIGMATVLFIGVRDVQSGNLTLGELLLVVTYLVQVYAPLELISKKIGDMEASLVSAERAFSVLDEATEVAERTDARSLCRATGAISFRDVSFAYTPGRSVLSGISFEVPSGSRVGIAGTTGAGKTTLVSLLTRFYDPTAGQITLDGIDLRDYRLADLRGQFAIVQQEPVLFSASIAENIAYARPDAALEEVIAAAKAANMHDAIIRLPNRYDTQVGERGMQLSGGERQRISLARAFLKDAPLLILDEPTSSVDIVTEAAIMEAFDRLINGRTVFIIAHRLTTLDGCDIQLRLERGSLVCGSEARPEPQAAST